MKKSGKKPDTTNTNAKIKNRRLDFLPSYNSPFKMALNLQRTLGNHIVQKMLKLGVIQAKLKVGKPNDKYEQEAEKVAEEVLRIEGPDMSNGICETGKVKDEHTFQRQPKGSCPECKDNDEEKKIQSKPIPSGNGAGPGDGTTSVNNVINAGGYPLDPETRTIFEMSMGQDFTGVKIHTDDEAIKRSRELNAKAFTHGRHIYFGAGQYDTQSMEGKQLLAHELTHVMQQATGRVEQKVQRDLPTDIRAEATLPTSQQTPGRLGLLETQSRTAADQAFQRNIGGHQLQPGVTGRATQIINHVTNQIAQLENARARGFQQAISAILGQQALNASETASFWLSFAGNTLWALSGLVPLLGPVVGVSRIAQTVGRIVLVGQPILRTNAIGRFLRLGGGAVATAVVGVAGAELAQFSRGIPSGSSLPNTVLAIQTVLTNVNSRIMARYRSEAFALTLEYLNIFPTLIDPSNTVTIEANFLENFIKGTIMETLFADLNMQNILDRSNYTINPGRAQDLAMNDMLQEYILRFGTVRDVAFQTSTDEIGNRLGATGTDAALRALGGESIFAGRLHGDYALVLGNVNGTLSDWGAVNTMPMSSQSVWSRSNVLSSGSHTVPFRIADKALFATRLNGTNYDSLTRGVRSIRSMSRRGVRWPASVIPSSGTASFVSSDNRTLVSRGRNVFGLQELTIEFAPSGTFHSAPLSERSTIEPFSRGQVAAISFSGNPERIKVHIARDVAF